MARRGVNKVILLGNLGADPEVRYMPNGDAVATISLATSESWKDKNTNETNERTEWHRVVFFRRQAELVGEYLEKGSKLYVEGRLRTKRWTDRENIERFTTEVLATEMQFIDFRNSNNDGGQAPQTTTHQPQEPPGGSEFEDDIPF